MVRIDLPVIGDKIEIETPDFMAAESKRKYLISQIMDIASDSIYFIATPIVNNVLAPIPVGETIKVKYAKKDAGVYIFNAKVLGRKNVDNISYMKIEKVGQISKTQRRNFFRLEVLLNVLIRIKNNLNDEIKTVAAFTKDLSGGGVRLISKESLVLESMVTLIIDTKKEPIEVEGKVVRCVPFNNNDFDVGIIFEDIDEAVRTRIISFIFEEQRKMRKKGLI